MSEAAAWISKKAAATLFPGQVERTLRRLAEQWPAEEPDLQEVIEQFPLGENALLHLLAVSSVCAARLAQDPQTLVWLRHPDVCASTRSRRRMLADLGTGNVPVGAQNFRAAAPVEGPRDAADRVARSGRCRAARRNNRRAFAAGGDLREPRSWNIGKPNCAIGSVLRPRNLPCLPSENLEAAS